MHLVAAGLNHRTAPVDLRERVAISDARLTEALRALVAPQSVAEGMILSTCNRTELYIAADTPLSVSPEDILTQFLAASADASPSLFSGHAYYYRDERAAEHLMRVSSGLDSMIVGESQIIGQVKAAYDAARKAGTTGPFLNTLVQSSLAIGKRVRSETMIGQGAFSVGSAAVELATRIFGETLSGKTVLVLGAGKMSELTVRHLHAQGAPAVIVTNRTYDRAVELARQIGEGAVVCRFDELPAALSDADIVICSTAAPHPVVSRDMLASAMRARRNRPLFLVDIAVPRDVEPDAGNLSNVYLYNIDDLSQVVSRDHGMRLQEAAKAEQMIDAAVVQFREWRRSLEVVPLVAAVRGRLDALRHDEMSRIRSRLPHLADHDLRVIETSLQSVCGKVAHDATVAIKACALAEDGAGYARLDGIRDAFGLDTNLRDGGAPGEIGAAEALAPEATHSRLQARTPTEAAAQGT